MRHKASFASGRTNPPSTDEITEGVGSDTAAFPNDPPEVLRGHHHPRRPLANQAACPARELVRVHVVRHGGDPLLAGPVRGRPCRVRAGGRAASGEVLAGFGEQVPAGEGPAHHVADGRRVDRCQADADCRALPRPDYRGCGPGALRKAVDEGCRRAAPRAPGWSSRRRGRPRGARRRTGQPMLFAPSMVSRMMSACPAC